MITTSKGLDSEDLASEDESIHRPGPRRVARSGVSRRRLIIVAIVLAAAAGFLLYKAVSSAVVYFKTAQEALSQRAVLGDQTFQLEGTVAKGSIEHANGSDTTSFTIYSGSARVRVENTGTPPQLFGAGIPVVLVGHFVGASNNFFSDQILVKHSNQYIAAHPARVRATNGSVH